MALEHKRQDSYASLFSAGTLTDIDSASSIHKELEEAEKTASGSTATATLLESAHRILARFENDHARLYPHLSDAPGRRRIDHAKLLKAMLECAPSEDGRRYVAASIHHCTETHTLVDLANTWYRYLLLPFKANRTPQSFPASKVATPTLHTEIAHTLNAHKTNRDADMRALVRLRQKYQCPLTGVYHRSGAPPDAKPKLGLKVSHIIKRAVVVFTEKDKGSFATWDILRSYTGWTPERTQEVLDKLGTPLNGILMEHDFHDTWENYVWSLKPAVNQEGEDEADTYDVQIFREEFFPTIIARNKRIRFEDHGDEPGVRDHAPESDKRYFNGARPLPDPSLIALHRALCGVLHLSGAAEVIDETFLDAGNADIELPSSKPRTADDIDTLLAALSLIPH